MPAATAIIPLDRPTGHFQHYQFTLDPGSIGAGGTEVETVAIPGTALGDVINVCPQPALSAGLAIAWARAVPGSGIAFALINVAGAPVDNPSIVWNVTIMRGSTMAFLR